VDIQIGIMGVIVAFAIGAAAIAVWIELRFPNLSPKSPGYAFLHIVGAYVACNLTPLGMSLTAGRGTIPSMMAGLFLVAFPVILYVWLSLLWLTKLITSELKGRYG
jgi:Fe2+ transport system protein B